MPATMQTADSAFQTVHPGENGYMVAVDEDPELERDQAAQRSRGGFGCCSRGSSGAAEKTKAMTYVGVGGGEYIVEQRYKYIGPSGGEFSIAEPDQKRPASGRPCWCYVVPLLLVASLVFGWLFVPEQDRQMPLISVSTPEPSTTERPSPRIISISMKIVNVNFNFLLQPGNEQILKHFLTEVQEGIAVTAGSGILTESVVPRLTPGSNVLHATIRPPALANVGHLRSTVAAESDHVALGVMNSIKMMRRIEEIQQGAIEVVDVEVGLVADEEHEVKAKATE